MRFLYNIGLCSYVFLVRIVSMFNPKAKLFYNGRKGLLQRIKREISHKDPIIWFHCSSVGEFEQARPIIEWYKKEKPKYKILLTFFSPSGYELRKNYELADWIYYMPVDTQKNARVFVQTVKPVKAIFIKYEFWYNYLAELSNSGSQIYIVSAIFRPTQMFFKWYGFFFRRMLKCYTKIFVQDNQSRDLLSSIGIQNNVLICGDTRFDRVYQITHSSKEFPLIKKFSENHFTIVAGSTWEPDEAILAAVIKNFSSVKLVIAPHEIHKARIDELEKTFVDMKVLRFSSFDKKFTNDKYSSTDILAHLDSALLESNVVIIDCLGILSSIYRYGQLAYIGGGFGVGIHNILEAATYSIPVVFGPNYQKFKEAKDLIELGGAISISDKSYFYDILDKYVSNRDVCTQKGSICGGYVKQNLGATQKVISNL
ncbi:MAG: glycosyltransferase N-terminal domain-containing protein [Bacteroidales bacterium]